MDSSMLKYIEVYKRNLPENEDLKLERSKLFPLQNTSSYEATETFKQ